MVCLGRYNVCIYLLSTRIKYFVKILFSCVFVCVFDVRSVVNVVYLFFADASSNELVEVLLKQFAPDRLPNERKGVLHHWNGKYTQNTGKPNIKRM